MKQVRQVRGVRQVRKVRKVRGVRRVREVRGVLRESAQFEQVTRVGADGRYLAPSSPGLP